MTTSTAVSPLADPTPPAPQRARVLLLGSAFGSAASALVVLTLLATYLGVRAGEIAAGRTALPEGVVLPLTPGNMGMTTLLMSGVIMAWIVHSLRNDDRVHAYVGLAVFLVLGVAFINSTVYLYQQLALPPTEGPIAGLLYATTAAHLVMVVVGMLFVAVMGFHALGGQLTGRDAEGMSAAALYWYVQIGVYAALWFGIYITK